MKNPDLSSREKQVATLLVRGLSYKEIAEQLDISFFTVIQHAHKVFEKTGCISRIDLMVKRWNQFGKRVEAQGKQLPDALTGEQSELLKEILSGLTDAQIAHKRGYHRTAITKKVGKLIKLFGAENKAQMVYFAMLGGFDKKVGLGGQS